MIAAVWVTAALTGATVLLVWRPRPVPGGGPPAAPPSGRDRSATHRRSPLLMAAGSGCGAWFVVGGWPGVPVGVVAGVAAWRVLARREPAAVRRRREALEQGTPLAVELLAASVSAGSAPTAALGRILDVVDPVLREELRPFVAKLRLGADPATVWAELGGHPQLGSLGRSLHRAVETGAAVTTALEELSAELRLRARADVEARARAVGVRAAAPLGLCLLPAFLLLGIVPLIAGLLPVLLGR